MGRVVLAIVFALPIGSAAIARDGTTKFAGYYEFSPLDGAKADTTTLVVRDRKGWRTFLDSLPEKVPGRTKRLDAVNTDPVLKVEVDWEQSMIVVVRSRVAVPNIALVRSVDMESTVAYELEDDLAAHPAEWGSYSAWVVPRRPKVRFWHRLGRRNQPVEQRSRE